MKERFEMVVKTFQGLEEILAEELRGLGAEDVEPGLRMVSFMGDKETLYRANMCCRTALRVLKPFYKFYANSPDELYERSKEFDWSSILGPDKTFQVDTVANSEEISHSRYATYRVKDAICDWFKERYGDKRPRVSTSDPDIIINLHISGDRVTLSLDSSGESLHKRGYRISQTDAPINEVLAAGIILKSGWRGEKPFIDPMCGSGTFVIEAALIAANINPGVFRSKFAFEKWRDFDAEIFDNIYNDDSKEKEITVPIIGSDISPKAINIAQRNVKSARVHNMVTLEVKSLADWNEAPANGVLVTNPPYGERLNYEHLNDLYALLGTKLKHVFKGYHAWIIGYRDEHFAKIGLAPSIKLPLLNGSLECKLQEYIIFEGTKRDFRKSGGELKKDAKSRKEIQAKNDRRRTPGERFKKAFDNYNVKRDRQEDRASRPQKGRRSDDKRGLSREKNGSERPRMEIGGMFIGRQPKLPPQEGSIMRDRRAGWKKRPEWFKSNESNLEESQSKQNKTDE